MAGMAAAVVTRAVMLLVLVAAMARTLAATVWLKQYGRGKVVSTPSRRHHVLQMKAARNLVPLATAMGAGTRARSWSASRFSLTYTAARGLMEVCPGLSGQEDKCKAYRFSHL